MTDSLLILRKLSLLGEHIARAERRRSPTFDEFAADVDRQDATSMSLLVAAQEVVDVALHIAAEAGWGVPDSSGEAIDLLATHGVIMPELARAVRAVVAVRDRVAHGYGTVDLPRLWAELPAGLTALRAFAAAIAAWLDRDSASS